MARPKLSGDKTKMTISFTEFDVDVYDYLKGTKNASRLIKELVRAHMFNGGQLTVVPPTTIVSPERTPINRQQTQEIAVTTDDNRNNFGENNKGRSIRQRGYADIQSNNDIGDVDALADIDL